MVMILRDLFELRKIQQPREFVKVKHVLVFAVLAKERHVLAQIHIFEVIGDKASIAALYALAKFSDDFFLGTHSLNGQVKTPCGCLIATAFRVYVKTQAWLFKLPLASASGC